MRGSLLDAGSAAVVAPVLSAVLTAVASTADAVDDHGCGADRGGGTGHRSADHAAAHGAGRTKWHVSSLLLPRSARLLLRRPARPRWMRRWPGSGSGRWRSAAHRPG